MSRARVRGEGAWGRWGRLGAIARGQVEPEMDVRLSAALRMPPAGIGVTRVLQACDAILAALSEPPEMARRK